MGNKKKILRCVIICGAALILIVADVVWIKKDNDINTQEDEISVIKNFSNIFGEDGEFGLEAHRGICDEYPENTLLSFEEAGKVDVYRGIETDVQMTSDGVFVCMHDNTIDRTTNGEGAVSDYTYQELMDFWIDGGYGWSDEYSEQLKIATLDDYLDVCRRYNKVPYMELKLLSDEALEQLVNKLKDEGWERQCVLTSFSLDYIKKVAELTDQYPLEYMTEAKSEQTLDEIIDDMEDIPNIIYRPSTKKVTKELVEACREENIAVESFALKVADDDRLQELMEYGLLGATCNSYKGLSIVGGK